MQYSGSRNIYYQYSNTFSSINNIFYEINNNTFYEIKLLSYMISHIMFHIMALINIINKTESLISEDYYYYN